MLPRRSVLLTAPLAAAGLAGLASPRALGALAPVSESTDAVPDPTAALAAGTAAVRGFSADFYRALAVTESDRDNLVCSPLSVGYALAMARAGARGATASEMDHVLHAPEPAPRALDAGLHAIDELVISQYRDQEGDGSKLPRLAIANSLWPRLGLAMEPAFTEILATYYHASAHPVDFANATEAARREINAWVGDHSYGKIPELLKPGVLSPEVALVLANALYLRASWQYPFDPKATRPEPFTRDDGQLVTVPMMIAQPQELGYGTGDGWIAVDLPYVGSRLAMAVVVPTRGQLRDLESTIDERWLTALLTGFKAAPVTVRLPRWSLRLPTDLGALLSGLGMPTAFSARADFSGITRTIPLSISKVIHETFITVDEKGTEAAAATAVVIKENGGPHPKPVVADRPFCYVIHDVPSATPLFVGRVADPTVS